MKSPAAILLLSITALAGCAGTSDELDSLYRTGSVTISTGLAWPIERPSTFVYSRGSAILLTDPRIDVIEAEQNLEDALAGELAHRDLNLGALDAAPLTVSYLVVGESGDAARATLRSLGLSPEAALVDGGVHAGSLVVAITDSSNGNLAWRGTLRGAINPDHSAEQRNQRIRVAAEMILREL